MIVYYLDARRAPIGPDEAYAPLIVYADGMLSLAIAVKSFKTIARRNTQVIQIDSGHKIFQFTIGDSLERTELADGFTLGKTTCCLVSKTGYHRPNLMLITDDDIISHFVIICQPRFVKPPGRRLSQSRPRGSAALPRAILRRERAMGLARLCPHLEDVPCEQEQHECGQALHNDGSFPSKQ